MAAWGMFRSGLILVLLNSTMVVLGQETQPPSTVPDTPEPSVMTTSEPTALPTPEPTSAPSVTESTNSPSASTSNPTVSPTTAPTTQPTSVPTIADTFSPSSSPSSGTLFPTSSPSLAPTTTDSNEPSASIVPTVGLAMFPSSSPSAAPSISQQPSIQITTNPSGSPTESASLMPTVIPTIPPTPSPDGPVAVNGTVGVILGVVSGEMNSNTLESFRFIAETFLVNALGMLEQPISNVQVTQVYNQKLTAVADAESGNAGLQQLTVQLDATGEFVPRDGFSMTADDLDYSRLLRNVFTVQSPAFISLLKESGNDYFVAVTSVSAVVQEPNLIDGDPSNGGSSSLSTGVIVAIVLGTAAVLLLFFAGFRYARSTTPRPSHYVKSTGQTNTSLAVNTSMGSHSSKRNDSFWAPLKKPKKEPPNSARSSNLSYIEETPASPESESSSYSYRGRTRSNGGDSWNGSYLGNSTVQGGDNLSYAYSLDDGIEDAATYDPGSVAGGAMGASGTFSPPNMAPSFQDEIPPGKVQRECFAPPGRLGIVVDTTLEGPRVLSLNDGSPLEGVLFPDDLIVAIDDVDTKNMTANAIGQLMAASMGRRRKLTLWSDDALRQDTDV